MSNGNVFSGILKRQIYSSDRIVPSAAEKLEKKRPVQLDASTVEIEERGVKVKQFE